MQVVFCSLEKNIYILLGFFFPRQLAKLQITMLCLVLHLLVSRHTD